MCYEKSCIGKCIDIGGYSGYYTVELGSDIKLDKGESFSVVFTLQGNNGTYVYTESSYINGKVVGNKDNRWLEFRAHTDPGQSFISVNGNTGYVTTTNYSGSATITTTITGSLGDTTTVDTSVTNPGTVNATVALNVEVPGATTETVGTETVTTYGTAEIVWYIDNSKGSDGVQFSNVYYTK